MATSSLLSPSSLWVCGWVFFGALLSGVLAYSTGAPENRCSSMVPQHGQSLLSYTDPFTVTASSSTYSPLQLITVTISPSQNGLYIRGFLLQARPANSRDSDTRVGFFISGSGSKTACNSGAVTHSYSTDRSSVTVSWRAPASPRGPIVFRATVVRTYSDYYTKVDSSVLSVQNTTTSTTTTTTTATITGDDKNDN